METKKPLLIVGLGNPGIKYAVTRHNAGFMALDAIAGDDAVWKKEKDALILKGNIQPETNDSRLTTHDSRLTILAKPTTFMNNSGRAVQSIMAFYKIPLENLIVIHDDMDLKLGDVRVKIGGGSAGHNGIKSIDTAIGNNYKRIRIGIGHPRDFDSPVPPEDWVLNKFSPTEIKIIADAIENKVMPEI